MSFAKKHKKTTPCSKIRIFLQGVNRLIFFNQKLNRNPASKFSINGLSVRMLRGWLPGK